ncbi:hypothetical protein OROGR_026270 [Orobanche gracilis]
MSDPLRSPRVAPLLKSAWAAQLVPGWQIATRTQVRVLTAAVWEFYPSNVGDSSLWAPVPLGPGGGGPGGEGFRPLNLLSLNANVNVFMKSILSEMRTQEEEARRLAEEARAQEKLQARKAEKAAEEARYRNALKATADALYRFFTGIPRDGNTSDISRDWFYQKLVKVSNLPTDHEDDTASPIQPVDMPARNGKDIRL